ncbi:MAG: IspD/TarI family cytidylyltransferase [Candidatus Limnocylindrales bacterium]
MRQDAIVAIIPMSADDPAITVSVIGRPVIEWTVRRLQKVARIERIVLAVDGVTAAQALEAIDVSDDGAPTTIATGSDRTNAIRAALELAGQVEAILLCPPDRALGPASVIEELALQSAGVDGVAAARPVRSTLKRVIDGRVVGTVSRDAWRSEAAPWLFRRDALERALGVATETEGRPIIDGHDLSQVGRLRVRLIDADATDLPIRTPADARFAERWLASRDGGPAR